MSGWATIYNTTISALARQEDALSRLAEQASSGLRIQRPSDSPTDASRIMQLTSHTTRLDSYTHNIDTLNDSMGQASNVLQEFSTTVTRVRALASQVASGTYDSSNAAAAGQEVDSLLEQVVYLANSSTGGQYPFGGANTTTPPFAVERQNGRIVSVTYQGSQNNLPVVVAPGVQYASALVGDQVLTGNSRGSPQFLGNTGAKAGSGTSSLRGDAYLTVSHDTTTYAGSSQLAAGTSSASGDTLLGAHTFTVDMPAKTVQLDDGPAVSFADAGTDLTNLAVRNGDGEVLYVDVSSVASDFQGTVAATSTGRLSVDDNATTTAIDPAADNLAVTDSRTGKVLLVDARSITRTGLETVQVPGTNNVFDALINVRDLMTNTRNLDQVQQRSLLSQSVSTLDEVLGTVAQQVAAVGGKMGALDNLKQSLANLRDRDNTEKSGLQDADVAQIAIDLTKTQTLYQMTLTTTAKMLSMSLLDFIK